ncbi:unnamed protein product [Chilo suppressalis]|uniref:ZAD domain-containing protein n=1 Tax=Chilo suppressalis TaxID=168631 RepID=A0ABN8B8K0_CHISP|nr:unnamed protein product [Chilo suppressalis]
MGKKRGKSKGSKQTSESVKKDENHSILGNEIDVIAAALNSTASTPNQVIFLKVCRLCESKDGPFLNIFDQDKVTAKKIDELMPFGITENDDLPHKICFRCSAKVEELYEFIQKCIKTQNSLRHAMGKKEPLVTKPKTRALWEEKLNKSNMSNDDICDALIKKAMEGIKDIPLNVLPSKVKEPTPVIPKKESKLSSNTTIVSKKEIKNKKEDIDSDDSEKPLKDSTSVENINESKFVPTRASRSQNTSDNLLDGLQDVKRKKMSNKQNDKKPSEDCKPTDTSVSKSKGINDLSFDYDDSSSNSKSDSSAKLAKVEPQAPDVKPFDIMDHVSMIKVNGVGVLFQCKLCNRNFLKKELVMSHGCAKTGVPRIDLTKKFVPPTPPKVPVVKYINTKVDNDSNKSLPEKKSEAGKQEIEMIKPPLETKSKPKIGPASKVKRQDSEHDSVIGMTVVPMEADPTSKPKPPPPPTSSSNNSAASPLVQFPSIPSLNSRYKLVPGPNNTFQLVEESSTNQEPIQEIETRKRKSDPPITVETKSRRQNLDNNKNRPKSPEVIEVGIQSPVKPANANAQPYPVGLFQTLPHHSGMFTTAVTPETPFTTPAMKKQSYTVVQTGNPSKLLISTKPQAAPEEPPPKRKSKKSKPEVKSKAEDKQPFSVTLEDTTPPKDAGFFTFINVDPLLQPSYVLPTDNIIQESQISTSTPLAKTTTDNKEKDKYTCNMCTESFSREKKLLTHIQSHYNKMDEEDQMRADKTSRKRGGRKH